MLDENKTLFAEFGKIHKLYEQDEEKWQEKFNSEGAKVIEVLRDYENRLCANTERGVYNKFSAGLSEKFQLEAKKHFPLIDHIGLKVQTAVKKVDPFQIKKIKL